MKNYIIKKINKKYKKNSFFWIYRIKNNIPVFIGEWEYNPVSTRGIQSEAMTRIAELWEIPKKYANKSLYYEDLSYKIWINFFIF